MRQTIFNYLNTKHGENEIECVSIELEKMNKQAKLPDAKNRPSDPEAIKRRNIYAIFRKYDADGSNSIDREELKTLLNVLHIPIKDDEVDNLVREIEGDGASEEIEFEKFYACKLLSSIISNYTLGN